MFSCHTVGNVQVNSDEILFLFVSSGGLAAIADRKRERCLTLLRCTQQHRDEKSAACPFKFLTVL